MLEDSKMNGKRLLPWWMALLCLTTTLGLVGCGSEGLAPVKGLVTFDGKPITGGMLVFSPVDEKSPGLTGRPASAEVRPDGSYTLGTNRPSDGARVGRHRVGFTPPPQQLTEQQRTDPNYEPPAPPYMGLVLKATEVEVKSGANTINLELVAP